MNVLELQVAAVRAYDEGHLAFSQKRDFNDCPHRNEPQRAAWQTGWQVAAREYCLDYNPLLESLNLPTIKTGDSNGPWPWSR